MQGFRDHGPKVPVVLSGPHVGLRVPFDGVVEVGEQKRVPYKEHRSVVPDEVPVPVLGVEFDGETPDVALGIGGPSLPGHGGESDEYLGLLPDLREQFRLGIAGYVSRGSLRDRNDPFFPRTIRPVTSSVRGGPQSRSALYQERAHHSCW